MYFYGYIIKKIMLDEKWGVYLSKYVLNLHFLRTNKHSSHSLKEYL